MAYFFLVSIENVHVLKKSHSTLLFSQFFSKKSFQRLDWITSLDSYLQNFSHRNFHVKKEIKWKITTFFSSIENWKMSTWIMLHFEKRTSISCQIFFQYWLIRLRRPFSNIFRDSFTLQEVFPFTESISQTFLSTLLHCLPTFIPLLQKIQMLSHTRAQSALMQSKSLPRPKHPALHRFSNMTSHDFQLLFCLFWGELDKFFNILDYFEPF